MKYPNFSVTFYLEGAVRQLRTVERGVNSPSTKTELGIFAGQSGLNSHDVINLPRQCTITRTIGPEVYGQPDKYGMPSRTWMRSNMGANPKNWPARWKTLDAQQKCDAHVNDIAHDLGATGYSITEIPA